MPNVPNAPGVPILSSFGDSIPLLVADAIGLALEFLGASGGWGLYLFGFPALEWNSVLQMEYKQDWSISDYQVEQGGFQSYDKVQLPFDARMRVVSGSSEPERALMLAQLDFVGNSLQLFTIVTPERIYPSVNVQHVDYRRTAQEGLGQIVADLWLLEVRVSAAAQFSNTQQPSEAGQQAGGNVQPQAPAPQAQQGFDERGFTVQ